MIRKKFYYLNTISLFQNKFIFFFLKKLTLKSTSPQNENVKNGPSIRKTVSPPAFLIAKLGQHSVHSCSTLPIIFPGGEDTSIDCKQHGKQQLSQANGLCKWIISFR